MNKLLLLAIVSFFLFCDQLTATNYNNKLTLSKDSLKVYTYDYSDSIMDRITINNYSEDSIYLDSAYMLFDVFDTEGFYYWFHNKTKAFWKEEKSGEFGWYLKEIEKNKYKLLKIFASNDPLRFSPKSSCVLTSLCVGANLWDDRMHPIFPVYLKGSLQLFFSNKQIVNIKLFSDDLRVK